MEEVLLLIQNAIMFILIFTYVHSSSCITFLGWWNGTG